MGDRLIYLRKERRQMQRGIDRETNGWKGNRCIRREIERQMEVDRETNGYTEHMQWDLERETNGRMAYHCNGR